MVCVCVCFVGGGGGGFCVCSLFCLCVMDALLCVCVGTCFVVWIGGAGGGVEAKGVKSSVFLCFAHVCLAQDINTQ